MDFIPFEISVACQITIFVLRSSGFQVMGGSLGSLLPSDTADIDNQNNSLKLFKNVPVQFKESFPKAGHRLERSRLEAQMVATLRRLNKINTWPSSV